MRCYARSETFLRRGVYNEVHDPRKKLRDTAERRIYAFFKLALALLMRLILGTNHHNFAVSFNNFAFIAHRLYRRSDFHNKILLVCFA